VVPSVHRLEGPTLAYAWGSRTLIAELRGLPAAAEPEAEIWFGAHPSNRASVIGPGGALPLAATAGFEEPRVLVKLLAAATPLSLQVHPDDATAQAGFAAEEADAVPIDAPGRVYRDPSGKPELLRAVTPMRLLCGLRPAGESAQLLHALAPEAFADLIVALQAGEAGLHAAVALLLTSSTTRTRDRLDALRRVLAADSVADGGVASDRSGPVQRAIELAGILLDRHPHDPGVLVALLLNDVDLAPGEAVFVAPGVLHAYVHGLGVEVMAVSDNVVRGGLTSKHVDVDEFLRILDARSVLDPRIRASASADHGRRRRFSAPDGGLVLEETDVAGEAELARPPHGPSILLCLAGTVDVVGASTIRLEPADAALISRDPGPVHLRGQGVVVQAWSTASGA
jgi:mannose-6-phosphate isomerase